MTLVDPQSIPHFDYSALDAETRIVVQLRRDELKTLFRETAQNIFTIGEKLADVRDRLQHNKSGGFDGWIEKEFGLGRSAAYRFINVYERFANRPNLGQLEVATSALYLLAAPSTPDDVVDQVIQRAESGEKITHKDARQAVDDARPAPRFPVITEMLPRILAALSAGPLRYVALRDALRIKPDDPATYDLRYALDSLHSQGKIRRDGGKIHLVPPPADTAAESGGEAAADAAALQDAAPPMFHADLVLHILLAGPQPFKTLLADTHLTVGDLRAAMNDLLATGRIVGRAGFYALTIHADQLTPPEPAVTGDPYAQLLEALRDHHRRYPTWSNVSRAWIEKHYPALSGADLEAALLRTIDDGYLAHWIENKPGVLFKRLACPPEPDTAPYTPVTVPADPPAADPVAPAPIPPRDEPLGNEPLAVAPSTADAARAKDAAAAIPARMNLERGLLFLLDAAPALLAINGIRSWYALDADSLTSTRTLIARTRAALAALDDHLAALDTRLDTMIQSGRPYDE